MFSLRQDMEMAGKNPDALLPTDEDYLPSLTYTEDADEFRAVWNQKRDHYRY